MNDTTKIELEWYGPFSIREILDDNKQIFHQLGLYQVYGSHPVNGADNLLYIGHTTDNFKSRFRNHHNDWIKHEVSEIQVYFGVVWNNHLLPIERQILLIQQAEKLLAYYTAPPYNSSLIYDIKLSDPFKEGNVRVINLWKKHRLPYEVSTDWYYSDCWNSQRLLLSVIDSI